MTTIIAFIIDGIIAYYVAESAKKRGMSEIKWGIFTLLIPVIAIPIFLVVRRPLPSITLQLIQPKEDKK